MLALAITPLRQLTGKAVFIRFRRMIGLYAFAYACLHFSAYLVLDLRGYWTQIFEEIAKRPYITVGFSAWLLLLPLAITSTQGWIRSEEHTSELQSLMRISYAVFCLKKQITNRPCR